jgi:hypothetical protein
MSGDTVRYGRITKRGNGYVRALPVQAAWAAVRAKNGGAVKERYEYMTKTKGISKKKAVAAAARLLGVLLYTLMKNKSKYEPGHFRKPGTAGKEPAGLALSA